MEGVGCLGETSNITIQRLNAPTPSYSLFTKLRHCQVIQKNQYQQPHQDIQILHCLHLSNHAAVTPLSVTKNLPEGYSLFRQQQRCKAPRGSGVSPAGVRGQVPPNNQSTIQNCETNLSTTCQYKKITHYSIFPLYHKLKPN